MRLKRRRDHTVCLQGEARSLSTVTVLIKTNPTNYGEQNDSDGKKNDLLSGSRVILVTFFHTGGVKE